MTEEKAEGDPLRGLHDDLEAQREFVRDRVPVYERILGLLPGALPRELLASAWGGRSFGAWYERPLLILAALRDDALEEGPSHPLFGAIGEGPEAGPEGIRTESRPDPDAEEAADGPADDLPEGDRRAASVDRTRLEAALAPERPVWDKLRSRYVQTNETSRAVAWLWPAHLIATADPDAALELYDVGTSAGLNLVGDALPRIWTRSDGETLVTEPLPDITTRRGYDLHPLDPDDSGDARWLRACVWPGQDDRLRRLDRAIAAWRASNPRPDLVAAGAGDVPDLLPREALPGVYRLVVQTVMRDYLSPEEWERYEGGMRRWLASSRPGRAVWVELEVTEEANSGGPPAAITVHTADSDVVLATCDPHPRVVQVDHEALEELAGRLG